MCDLFLKLYYFVNSTTINLFLKISTTVLCEEGFTKKLYETYDR